MIIASKLTGYRSGERAIAEELINTMLELDRNNDLLLFDRGYPSQDFIRFIESNNLKYLLRVSNRFLKVVVNAPKEDQVIEVVYKNEKLKMRVLKFELYSGIIEILITNIFDKDFSVSDFKELYFKRLGIEVKYNEIKSKLQIENFTGETPIAIEQDFYATMYLANMVSLAKKDAQQIIEEKYKDKKLKHEYKVNTNVLIGKLKDNLILLLLERNSRKRSKMLKYIESKISRNIIPIRTGRKFKRRIKSTETQNVITKKRAL